MNQNKTILENRRNSNLKISQAYNNSVKCSHGKSERFDHKLVKFFLAAFCWEHGLEFATEVTFSDGQRADFVVKDWNVAIEVLSTEGLNDFKKKTYPMPTVPISATMYPVDIVKMMKDLETLQGDGSEYYFNKAATKLQKNPSSPTIEHMVGL